jgi:hypothetical protein
MIELILLGNISIFQTYCLYAKYVPRFYGNMSNLKRKIYISQFYIHGVIYIHVLTKYILALVKLSGISFN